MRILLSNDDGYFSTGLERLAADLAPHAEITVVAPERDRSGASNSLTLDRPLTVRRASNGFLFVSGQVAIDPRSNEFVPGDIRQQTERALENLKGILEASGANLHHVVKTTVFLKDMNDFAAMNEVYGRFFTAAPPARSTVQVARLPKDALVEIEVIASL